MALDSDLRVISTEPEDLAYIQNGLDAPLYGAFLEKMVAYAAARVKDGHFTQLVACHAISTIAGVYRYAGEAFAADSVGMIPEEIPQHQENVLAGRIELLPEHLWTSVEEGRRQVELASQFLPDWDGPEAGAARAAIAELNYGPFFTSETMTNPLDTRLWEEQIEQLLARTTARAMPHLVISNAGIGSALQVIMTNSSRLHPPQKLRIIDIGSGPGSTAAAIASGLARYTGTARSEVAISLIEAVPQFHGQLVQFVRQDEVIASLGLDVRERTIGKGLELSEFGALTTVQGDVVDVLKAAKASEWRGPAQTIVVTANYSFHRLPPGVKAKLIEGFGRFQNVIFLIGDLSRNGSAVNRGYFNRGLNGPLNAGNEHLENLFHAWDRSFHVTDLGREVPAGFDPRLAAHLGDSTNDRGRLWIACKGRLAHDALDLKPVASNDVLVRELTPS